MNRNLVAPARQRDRGSVSHLSGRMHFPNASLRNRFGFLAIRCPNDELWFGFSHVESSFVRFELTSHFFLLDRHESDNIGLTAADNPIEFESRRNVRSY